MSDDVALRLRGVGKKYKLFPSHKDNLLSALGLERVPGLRVNYREFWALRGIDLDVRLGERLGVVGRNGAGKSTLLKLITGTVDPTEGVIEVNGNVQALLESGAGFHPDFTGEDNIRAALTYQGLTDDEIAEAIREIADFTELGDFLDQPFRTYSSGMKARLAFATATTVRPEILIVDEILGAGDAYFVSKSNGRMRELVESGAAMLLVSHSMLQITQLCESAIWVHRGEIVARGPSVQIVREYEQFIRKLDDRRLRARNQRRRAAETTTPEAAVDEPETGITVRFRLDGGRGAALDVRAVRLMSDGEVIEVIAPGSPQDASPAESSVLVLDGSSWSSPERDASGYYRRIAVTNGDSAEGFVRFGMLGSAEPGDWSLETEYRLVDGDVRVEVAVDDEDEQPIGGLAEAGEWQRKRLALGESAARLMAVPVDGAVAARATAAGTDLVHWPGEGRLRVVRLETVDGDGAPASVFELESTLVIRIAFEVTESGLFDLLPAVNLYRLDGINISTQLGDPLSESLEAGRTYVISVRLDDLNLGNGNYLVSVAMYRRFDPHLHEEAVAYDWVDRSLEFQVVGSPVAITSVFQHPSSWSFE